MDKLKILLIANMYPSSKHPYYGSFVKRFEDGLNRTGNVFVKKVVLLKFCNHFVKTFAYCRFYFSVYFSVLFSKADLIYVHYANHSLLPFILLHPFLRIPLVVNVHGSDVFYESIIDRFIGRITKPVLRHAKLVVVPSNYFKEMVINKLKIEKEKVFVSPSGGVYIDEFYQVQQAYSDVLRIGYLGRIDYGKGYDLALQTYNKLKHNNSIDCHFIVGGGGKELPKFWEYIDRYKLRSEIEYRGIIPYDQVSSFYKDIDILIFPSYRNGESLGLVPLEAMASGVPVFAFNNGAVKEYVKEGVTGYIFYKYESKELVQLIETYYRMTSSEKKKLSENAREKAKVFDNKRVSAKMLEKLQEVVNK